MMKIKFLILLIIVLLINNTSLLAQNAVRADTLPDYTTVVPNIQVTRILCGDCMPPANYVYIPRFQGGIWEWQNYIDKFLRRFIPADNNAPSGKYAVTISFLIDTAGIISEVKVLDAPNPDYGTSKEAIRIIEHSPRWRPATQNGKNISYRMMQKIIFIVNRTEYNEGYY